MRNHREKIHKIVPCIFIGDLESRVADSKASPSGERDVSSSPPFLFNPGGLDWNHERAWRIKVASRVPVDLSRVCRTSPFDALTINDLPQLSKKGAQQPICRVPKECLSRGNKDSLEHNSKLSGIEKIREFWMRVLALCPVSHTYRIAGGDRGLLCAMSSDGAEFFMYTSIVEDFGVEAPFDPIRNGSSQLI
ncbi:uncharacterized protein G2W53_021852 [Senna tora]|uniref:Uncharacterized protein n=1 Tax=Senna tora TaxID=362788 RepID=A0A834TK77_9FABA|nr:uncharacterized protein G2W53_021852 [Senna tora]